MATTQNVGEAEGPAEISPARERIARLESGDQSPLSKRALHLLHQTDWSKNQESPYIFLGAMSSMEADSEGWAILLR